MSPMKYRTILGHRLMIPLFPIDEVCLVCRKACLDIFEEHVVHCKELPDFKYIYDFVKNLLFDIFSRARVPVKKEVYVNFLTYTLDRRSTLRYADVMMYGWVGGKHACFYWGFTTYGIRCRAFYGRTSSSKSCAKQNGQTWESVFWQSTFFYTIFFDTSCFLAPEDVDLLHRFQKVMHSNVISYRSMNVVFTRIGFVIQKGLAHSLLLACLLFKCK